MFLTRMIKKTKSNCKFLSSVTRKIPSSEKLTTQISELTLLLNGRTLEYKGMLPQQDTAMIYKINKEIQKSGNMPLYLKTKCLH
jgi:hypothetical protein